MMNSTLNVPGRTQLRLNSLKRKVSSEEVKIKKLRGTDMFDLGTFLLKMVTKHPRNPKHV
jgi:hypothetical protein